MEFLEALEHIETVEAFTTWKKEHPSWYLVHGFLQLEEGDEWQIGYSDGDKVTTILLTPFNILPEQEVYKSPDKKIEALNVDEVVLGLNEALEIFNVEREEKYPTESIFKHIILLQVIDGVLLYNITGITKAFKTLNVRIGMDSRILSSSLDSLMQQN